MSKTQENLMAAFGGESMANRKYTAYALQAEKEGKKNVAKLFRAAAEAETLHALAEFAVAGKVGDTAANLVDAAAGETYEFTRMYPAFIEDAKEEGDDKALRIFQFAAAAEAVHARLYQEASKTLASDPEVTYYLCPICGNIETYVPEQCAICKAPGDKFKAF